MNEQTIISSNHWGDEAKCKNCTKEKKKKEERQEN